MFRNITISTNMPSCALNSFQLSQGRMIPATDVRNVVTLMPPTDADGDDNIQGQDDSP